MKKYGSEISGSFLSEKDAGFSWIRPRFAELAGKPREPYGFYSRVRLRLLNGCGQGAHIGSREVFPRVLILLLAFSCHRRCLQFPSPSSCRLFTQTYSGSSCPAEWARKSPPTQWHACTPSLALLIGCEILDGSYVFLLSTFCIT